MVSWGRSVVEPERGHVRGPETQVTDGVAVGFAICGAFLVDDLAGPPSDFPKCSVCLGLVERNTPVSAVVGIWLALRRLDRGGLTLDAGLFLNDGRPLPEYLTPPLRWLLDRDHAHAERRRVHVTASGRALYASLRVARDEWLASDRVVPFGTAAAHLLADDEGDRP